MPELKHVFTGASMNQDITPRLVPQNEYIRAINAQVATSEGSDVGEVQNVLGNEQVVATGQDAVTIGHVVDQNEDQVYFFVKGRSIDGIYEFDEATQRLAPVVQDDRGILNFNVNYLITGVNIIDQGENKLLAWTDGFNEPRIINIDRFKRNFSRLNQNTLTREILTLVKRKPERPPVASTVDIEQIRIDGNEEEFQILNRNVSFENRMPRFAYRWKFSDNQYSVISSFSEVVFEPGSWNIDEKTGELLSMVNQVKAVDVEFSTGSEDVIEVDLLYKETNSTDVYIVETFNKQDRGWSNNVDLTKQWSESITKLYSDSEVTLNRIPTEILSCVLGDGTVVSPSDITIEEGSAQIIFNEINIESGSTINITYIPSESPIRVTLNKIYRLLEGDQLERTSDVVPIIANSQEYVNGRLVFGGFEVDYDIIDENGNAIEVDLRPSILSTDIPATDISPSRTLKSDRDYQIAIQYSDPVGRHTPPLTSDLSSVNASLSLANKSNQLQIAIHNKPPVWASSYTILVKNTKGVSYSIFPIDIQEDPLDPEFRYYRLTDSDVDKVKTGDFVILKDANGDFLEDRELIKVEEIGSRPINFLEVEDQTSVVQRAGLWMRVRDTFAQRQISEDTTRVPVTSITAARPNSSRNVSNPAPIGTDGFTSYVDNSYYYPHFTATSNDPGGDTVTFGGTYAPGTGGGKGGSGSGPMRIEIVIRNGNIFDWFYYINDESEAGTSDGLYLFRETGATSVAITADAAITLTNGAEVTFSSSSTYNAEDRFTVVYRRTENFLWRWDNGDPNSTEIDEGGARTISVLPGTFADDGTRFFESDSDEVKGGSTISIWATDNFLSERVDGREIALDQASNTFTTDNPYPNLEEWMFETGKWQTNSDEPFIGHNSEGNPIRMSQFGFWRGNTIGLTFTSGVTRRELRLVTTATPQNDPLRLFIQSGVENPSGNRRRNDFILRTGIEYAPGSIPFGDTRPIRLSFETIPSDNNSALFSETGFYGVCSNGVHYGTDENEMQGININGDITSPLDLTLYNYYNSFSWYNGVESASVRDSILGASIDYGARVHTIYKDFKRVVNNTDLIFSDIFSSDSNTNNLNQFSATKFGNREIVRELDDSFGTVQRLYGQNDYLYVFHEDKVVRVLVGKEQLLNADGTSNIVSTDRFLGDSIPLNGEYGISLNPESLSWYGPYIYWADKNRGVICQMAGDTITEISDIGMRDFFRDRLAKSSRVYTGYNDYHNELDVSIQNEIIDPADDRFSGTLRLSRQAFLSRISAFQFPSDDLVFSTFYKLINVDSDAQNNTVEIGDFIYSDADRLNPLRGDNDWFVWIDEDVPTGEGASVDTSAFATLNSVGPHPVTLPVSTVNITLQDASTAAVPVGGSWSDVARIINQPGGSDTVISSTSVGDYILVYGDIDNWALYQVTEDSPLSATGSLDVVMITEYSQGVVPANATLYGDGQEVGGTNVFDAVNPPPTEDITCAVNIDNFGRVSAVECAPDYADLLLNRHEAFAASFNTYLSPEEACAKGIASRVLFHDGDDPSPDIGDLVYDTSTSMSEYDLAGSYVKGRTTRSGWIQIFDGNEDFVINVIQGQVVDKIPCSRITENRSSINASTMITKEEGESDLTFIYRLCNVLPVETLWYDGEGDDIELTNQVYFSNFLNDPVPAGFYTIEGGRFIEVNEESRVTLIDLCSIEVCIDQTDELLAVIDQRISNENSFQFLGVVNDAGETVAAGRITIEWSARGRQRYPSDFNAHFTMTRTTDNIRDTFALNPGSSFVLMDDAGNFDASSLNDTELEYSIHRFCYHRSIVPTGIGFRYYLPTLCEDDPVDLLDPRLEVTTAIYFASGAAVETYYTSQTLIDSNRLDGTNGTGTPCWWAFGDEDDQQALEALLINDQGEVIGRRNYLYPYEVQLMFGSSLAEACLAGTETTYLADAEFLTDGNDSLTRIVFPDFTSADLGWYADTTGADDRIVKQWNGSSFSMEDNCPLTLPPIALAHDPFNSNIACVVTTNLQTFYVLDAFGDDLNDGSLGPETGGIYTDPYGPNSVANSEAQAGYYADIYRNLFLWNPNGNTLSPVQYSCEASRVVRVSATDGNTVLIACDLNATEGLFHTGTIGNGVILYSDNNRQTQFVGTNNFYKIGNNHTGRINGTGLVSEYQECAAPVNLVYVSSTSSSSGACDLSSTEVRYFIGNLGNGTVLFTDEARSNAFDGDGNTYKIGETHTGSIASNGTISSYTICMDDELTPINVNYNQYSPEGAFQCADSRTVYSDSPNLTTGSSLFTTSAGTTAAANGWYREFNRSVAYPFSGGSIGSPSSDQSVFRVTVGTGSSGINACNDAASSGSTVFLNSRTLAGASRLFADANACNLASATFVASGNSFRQWNGSSFGSLQDCEPEEIVITTTPISLHFAATEARACLGVSTDAETVYVTYSGGSSFRNINAIYSNSSASSFAPSGWYSTGTEGLVLRWNSSGTIAISSRQCPVIVTEPTYDFAFEVWFHPANGAADIVCAAGGAGAPFSGSDPVTVYSDVSDWDSVSELFLSSDGDRVPSGWYSDGIEAKFVTVNQTVSQVVTCSDLIPPNVPDPIPDRPYTGGGTLEFPSPPQVF